MFEKGVVTVSCRSQWVRTNLCEAKVADVHDAGLVNHDVGAFDVAVDDAQPVQVR